MDKEEDLIRIYKWNRLVNEEIQGKNDRALLIIMASIIDMQLEKLLKTFMVETKDINKQLFSNNAPLSNFSGKIALCFHLGLISKHEYNNIEIIRKVRNKFAHEIELKRLEDSQSIIDLCNNFELPDSLYIPQYVYLNENGQITFEREDFKSFDLQEKFIMIFKHTTIFLEYRIYEFLEKKQKEYENSSYEEHLKSSKNMILKFNKDIYEQEKKYKLKISEILTKNIPDEDREKFKEVLRKLEYGIEFYESGKLFLLTIRDEEFEPIEIIENIMNITSKSD